MHGAAISLMLTQGSGAKRHTQDIIPEASISRMQCHSTHESITKNSSIESRTGATLQPGLNGHIGLQLHRWIALRTSTQHTAGRTYIVFASKLKVYSALCRQPLHLDRQNSDNCIQQYSIAVTVGP